MHDVGVFAAMMNPSGPGSLRGQYEKLSWERALEIAQASHLQYIVQYREVPYPDPPVYANSYVAVYLVPR